MANFADIVAVEVPRYAEAGDIVNVTAKVKNLLTQGTITVAVTGLYQISSGHTTINFVPDRGPVDAQKTASFAGSFNMPAEGVSIWVWAFYWGVDNNWHLDDEATASIALGEEPTPPPPPKPEIPWPLIAVAGAAAVGIVALKKKK